MGLLLFGPPAAFPKTLLQPCLVATPNQLILGDRTAEDRAAQKDLFVGKHEERPTQVNAQGLLREVHAAERLRSFNSGLIYFLVRLA